MVHSATYLRKCQETYHIRPQKPVMQLTAEACRMGPGADIAIIDRLTVRRKNAIRSHAPCVRLVWQDHRREHAAEGELLGRKEGRCGKGGEQHAGRFGRELVSAGSAW